MFCKKKRNSFNLNAIRQKQKIKIYEKIQIGSCFERVDRFIPIFASQCQCRLSEWLFGKWEWVLVSFMASLLARSRWWRISNNELR
jgi:uncharacterized alpha-E superfamily protein